MMMEKKHRKHDLCLHQLNCTTSVIFGKLKKCLLLVRHHISQHEYVAGNTIEFAKEF